MPVIVGSGKDDLQRAVDRSQPGDVLECPNDAVYGPLVLPGRRLDIAICARALPTQSGVLAAQLPTIESDSWARMPIESMYGTQQVSFVGICAKSTRTDKTDNPSSIVCLGQQGLKPATSMGQLPVSIGFDLCAIVGNGTRTMHGLIGNVRNLRVTRSAIVGIVHGNAESHGVYIDDTPGPVTIEHSYIEASGINVLIGGGSPWIPGQVVMREGFTFRWNTCTKRREWAGDRANFGCKNLFEIKNCHYADVYGNTFENCWPDNQQGMAILFTPREQNPTQYGKPARPAPYSGITRAAFIGNKLRNVSGGIHVLASDDIGSSVPLGELFINCNEMDIGDFNQDDKAPGTAFLFGSNDRTKPAGKVSVIGNMITFREGANKAIIKFLGPNPYFARDFVLSDNVWGETKYGIFGNGGTLGQKALETWCMRYTESNNGGAGL